MDFDRERDDRVRKAAFEWLGRHVSYDGEVEHDVVSRGFRHEGRQIALVDKPGILIPRGMKLPLSIRTSPRSQYDNNLGIDKHLQYRYAGTDPQMWVNVAMRAAMEEGVPLIYFHGIENWRYIALSPVYVVGDTPEDLTFTIACEHAAFVDKVLEYEDVGW